MSNNNNNINNNSSAVSHNNRTVGPEEQIQNAIMEQQATEVYVSYNNRRSHFSDVITPTRSSFKPHEVSNTAIRQQEPIENSNNNYYLARDSNVSSNSMPQFPSAAKSHASIRNQHHYYHQDYYHNSSLPRSPRIPSSLSDIIQNNAIRNNSIQPQNPNSYYNDQYSIIEIPLNTGDDDSINHEKKERHQVLQGASSSKTLVAMPTTTQHHHSQHFLTAHPSSNNKPANQRAQRIRQSWRATATESIFSILSAPSKISRTTTQHYVFSPPSLAELKQHHQGLNHYNSNTGDDEETVVMYMDDEKTLDSKGNKKRHYLKKPSQRGICNTMTIATVIVVILFLFAGYPLSVHIAKQTNENNHSTS